MAAEDYFDPYDYDEEHAEDVTCNRCGAEDLDWVDTGTRWRLLNPNGTFHVCNTAASADEFEDIS